jgi:short-subunit dehydrogenase
VVALGESLRAEMAPHGVGVSTLCPGLVTSNLGRTSARLGMTRRSRQSGPGAPEGQPGMEPAVAGEIAVQGIAENQAYIVTHPELWPEVEKRWRALEAAFSAA